MVSEERRSGSSWHSWMGAAESPRHEPAEAGTVPPEVAPAAPSDDPPPATRRTGGDDLAVHLDWGGDDDELADEPADADVDDELDVDELDAGEPGDGGDLGFDEYELEDEDDDGDGQLLPAVPLLPSIASRVDSLGGLLRSITMRVDGLSAATDIYRSTITDRIDEYTETILGLSRQTDQAIEEHRRANERTIAELRRSGTERAETMQQLVGRVEELTADLTEVLGNARPAGRSSDPALTKRLSAVETAVAELRTLVEVVVDTMPASAEGSGTDVAGELASLRETIEAQARVGVRAKAGALTKGDLEEVVGSIADAVVARLDLDALATLVAEHLSTTFEVVAEEPEPAKRGGRRR